MNENKVVIKEVEKYDNVKIREKTTLSEEIFWNNIRIIKLKNWSRKEHVLQFKPDIVITCWCLIPWKYRIIENTVFIQTNSTYNPAAGRQT